MQIDSQALLGFLRSIGVVIVIAVLSYIGDASHISFLGNPYFETLIASIALAIEHKIEEKSGRALFGVVKTNAIIGSGRCRHM